MTTSPAYTDVQRAEAIFLWDLAYPEGSKGAVAKVLGLPSGQTVNGFVMGRDSGGLQNLPEVPDARKAELVATYRQQLDLAPLAGVASDLVPASGGLEVVNVDGIDWGAATIRVFGPDGQPVDVIPPFPVADLIRTALDSGQKLAEARVELADERRGHDNEVRELSMQAAEERTALQRDLEAERQKVKDLEVKVAQAEAVTRQYRAIVALEMTTNGTALQRT